MPHNASPISSVPVATCGSGNLRRHPTEDLAASRLVGFAEGPEVEGLERGWGVSNLRIQFVFYSASCLWSSVSLRLQKFLLRSLVRCSNQATCHRLHLFSLSSLRLSCSPFDRGADGVVCSNSGKRGADLAKRWEFGSPVDIRKRCEAILASKSIGNRFWGPRTTEFRGSRNNPRLYIFGGHDDERQPGFGCLP